MHTPSLTFVVKGPERTAREKMFVRGIVAQTIGSLRNETVFKADIQFRELVTKWFCEHDELIQGYGSPDGTCLIYSTHELETCPACNRPLRDAEMLASVKQWLASKGVQS